ncbi:hypothetical protein [Geothrix sp. 21YS21S-2]|uniref:hypothetical protein n=1 Tax=Geothrix sp. 21YS21S-2 TaxID=3068893 RepID=UPI0027B93A94|nr:hypothetical protein [Geothrix sp. 21YS21S-2]
MSRRENPFHVPVRPIPYDPYEQFEHDDFPAGEAPWLDYNLFTTAVVTRVIDGNLLWISDRPRNANEIREVLFPTYEEGTMNTDEILSVLCNVLFDAGFEPYGQDVEAFWTSPVPSLSRQ